MWYLWCIKDALCLCRKTRNVDINDQWLLLLEYQRPRPGIEDQRPFHQDSGRWSRRDEATGLFGQTGVSFYALATQQCWRRHYVQGLTGRHVRQDRSCYHGISWMGSSNPDETSQGKFTTNDLITLWRSEVKSQGHSRPSNEVAKASASTRASKCYLVCVSFKKHVPLKPKVHFQNK